MTSPISSPTAAALLFCTLSIALSAPALDLKPDALEIKTMAESATIAVTNEGSPVPASAIQSVKLFVEAHDYDHMIRVEKGDGQVTIHPTEFLELGVYDLRITTSQGAGSVRVVALQDIVKSDLASQAQRLGVSVEAIKAKLGISQPLGREQITLDIKGPYYVGQRLHVAMPAPSGRTGEWWINGERVQNSGGTLDHVLDLTGLYDLAYVEKEGEVTKAVVLNSVQVIAEPTIRVDYKRGATLTLTAPDGFGAYLWELDGEKRGSGKTWEGAFSDDASHELSVRATEPVASTGPAFRTLRYTIVPST